MDTTNYILYCVILYCVILYYIILCYIILYYIILYYIILYYIVLYLCGTCFDQLRGYPQDMRTRKTRIAIANVIFVQNETSVLLYDNAY
jgi:hypothetical protein